MKPFYPFLLLLLTLFISCSESEEYTPALTGTITGKVSVYNAYHEPESGEGVTIKVLGDGFELEGNTDQNGNYTLHNVPYGDWKYSISKPGFQTHYKQDFSLSEEKATMDLAICRAPAFHIDQADFYFYNTQSIRANITLSEAVPAGKAFSLITYLGKTPTVSHDNYLIRNMVGYTSAGNKNVQLLTSIDVASLKSQHGFKAGDKAYLIVYPAAAQIYGHWVGDQYKIDAGLNTSMAQIYTLTIPY